MINGAAFQALVSATAPWFGDSLEIGLNQALQVREERLTKRADACRLLYVSDIHLRSGRSNTLSRQILLPLPDLLTRTVFLNARGAPIGVVGWRC